jgi:CHASE3 domain sensor protein
MIWRVDSKGLVVALLLMVMTFVAVAAIAFQQQNSMISYRKLVIESYHLGGLLDLFCSLLQDAERGQHDFLVSGEQRHLVYFNRANQELEPTVAEILRSPSLDSDDARKVQRLKQLALEKMTELAIENRAQANAPGLAAQVDSDKLEKQPLKLEQPKPMNKMEQIRSIVDEIKAGQSSHRKLLTDQLRSSLKALRGPFSGIWFCYFSSSCMWLSSNRSVY